MSSPPSPDLPVDANPLGVPADADLFAAPPDDAAALWSETGFFATWSPVSAAGVWAHFGRCRGDLGLWWSHVATFLPDGRLAVDRSWSRSDDPRRLRAGNLTVTVDEPHRRWTVDFDGAGQIVTRDQTARQTVGSGVQTPMRWSITATAASPVWSLYGTATQTQSWAGDSHTQQTFFTSGRVRVGAEEFPIAGVGYNDHSRGKRDLRGFGADQWFIGVLPDSAIHVVDIWDLDGTHLLAHGAIIDDKGHRPITARRLDGVDHTGGPLKFDLVIDDPTTEPLVLAGKVLHALPITITDDNDNLNGAGWDLPGDPLLFTESVIELTTPDGRRGYANRELAMRRSTVARP